MRTDNTPSLDDMIWAVRFEIEAGEKQCLDIWPEASRRHMAALRAVLAHLEASRWRPIAEAPPDDTPILLYDGHCIPFIGSHTCLEMMNATHWMFLPSPPATTSEGELG